jgi:hypothetical protein
MHEALKYRFALAWALPILVAWAAWHSLVLAFACMAGYQVALALAERVPALQQSPPGAPQTAWHRACVRLHVPLQAGLLAWCLWLVSSQPHGAWAVLALGVGVGGVTGSLGITFAHELGHSKSRVDRHGRTLPRPPPAGRHLGRPGHGAPGRDAVALPSAHAVWQPG